MQKLLNHIFPNLLSLEKSMNKAETAFDSYKLLFI